MKNLKKKFSVLKKTLKKKFSVLINSNYKILLYLKNLLNRKIQSTRKFFKEKIEKDIVFEFL